MPILAMTRFRLKSIWLLPQFMRASELAVAQLRIAPGFLRAKLLAEPNLAMWTASLWRSEDSMRAYYLTGAHRKLMPELADLACEAIAGHAESESCELPSWRIIHAELCRVGRFSEALSEPSERHRDRDVTPPKFTFLTRPVTPASSDSG